LGIAESFNRRRADSSLFAGVVMRRDLVIDGFRVMTIPIGGTTITEDLIRLYQSFNRNDIRAILVQGTIIAWFNILNLKKFHAKTGIPIISITYDSSDGLGDYIKEYFPNDYQTRITQLESLKIPTSVIG